MLGLREDVAAEFASETESVMTGYGGVNERIVHENRFNHEWNVSDATFLHF